MEEEDKIEQEELDIKDLAQSSLEDESKSMFDLNEFKLPQIDFGSTDIELEEQMDEDEEEEESKADLPVDEVTVDFEAKEQNYTLYEESIDYAVTDSEKTEVAIIETVATDRLSDIRKEYESFGLQPPVTESVKDADTVKEGKGIQAASPMDFDADKFPPHQGAGTLPTSSAFYKVQGSPNIKIGENPYGYA